MNLAPLVDQSGTPLHDGEGAQLAADGDGLVYTIHPGQTPTAMGALADDHQGQVILVPLADDMPQQARSIGMILSRRRAHLRGRIAHHHGRLRRLAEAGAAVRDDRRARHLNRIEQLTAELAQVQQAIDTMPNNMTMAEAPLDGLGNFSDWWERNRKFFIGAAAGAGGALLARSAIDPDGYVGRLIRTGSFNDPATAEAERAAAEQAFKQIQAERDAAQARAAELARQAATASAHAARGGGSGFMSGSMPWLLLGGLALGGVMLMRRGKKG